MLFRRASVRYGRTPEPETPYQKAAQVWDERIGSARVQARNWRLIAFGNLFLAAGLAGGLIWQAARGTVTPWVVEVDKLGEAQAISRGGRGLPPDRSADCLAPRPLRRKRPRDPGRPRHRPPELARGLRLHHRQRRGRAQRLCPRQRSLRQGRQDSGRGRYLERDPRLERQLSRRLGRAPLREREPRGDGTLDRHSHRRARHAARRRTAAQESPRRVRPRHQLVEGARLMRSAFLALMTLVSTAMAGCATFKPPQISYDDAQPAVLETRASQAGAGGGAAKTAAVAGPAQAASWGTVQAGAA